MKYSDQDKAVALAALQAKGGDKLNTAKALGIPRTTLNEWARGEGISPAVTELRQEKKESLISRYERIVHLALDRVEQVIGTADCGEAMKAATFSTNSLQLLKGEPTVISQNLSAEEKQAKLNEIRQRKELQKAG